MEEQKDSKSNYHFSLGKVSSDNWKSGHPLTVKGCMIMQCMHGNADLTINSSIFTMGEGDMVFIVFDMVAVPVAVSDDFEARFLYLDFDASQDIFFLVTSNRFWEFVYTYPVIRLRRSLSEIVGGWFSMLTWIMDNCSGFNVEKIIRNEMENFMLVMAGQVESRLGLLGTNPPKNRAWSIINEFLGLLNRYCTHRRDVAFYADKLSITPNYLNIIAKRNLGVSAKEHINIQSALIVKMLLDTTDLSIKEIAERLNYDDPSYLCRIFRKQTGLSPIQYRNKQRGIL